MKRKRLEAWAVVGFEGDYWSSDSSIWEEKFDADDMSSRCPQSSVVRLVECGPDETVVPKAAAAVVRAAVELVEDSRHTTCLWESERVLRCAVEKHLAKKGGKR